MSRRSRSSRDRAIEQALHRAVSDAMTAFNDACNEAGTPIDVRRSALVGELIGHGVVYYRLCGGTRSRFLKLMCKAFDEADAEVRKASAVVHTQAGHA